MDSNGEIEEKLDAVVLEFFSTLDDLYKEQTCLNEDMKNGFLQMSRARYNMGAKAISQSQYDENKMAASIKVDVEDGSKGGNLVLISNMTSVVNENPAEDASVETIGLRKRNVPKSEQNMSTEEKETDHQEKKGSAETPVSVNKKQFPDPLNWFGVLVPQSLRHSQASFKHAIEQTVKIANLKLKLEELRKNYIDCMGMKVKEKLNLVADK
ncbi:coiled-coil domain-containing protein 115-like [Ylistrum balloti]|uniref:coiled-coil domain-containing protein 115-like n=1 Tax=Ylistrum balloti TaxID=509963 RepID=UPI002905E39C|nr:coiled-coil domain-containing protein 115-like [Ylistrum balloti]